MARFYNDVPNQVIWDGASNKVLCVFKDGILDTEDEWTISVLKDTFKNDIVEESVEVVEKPKVKNKGVAK